MQAKISNGENTEELMEFYHEVFDCVDYNFFMPHRMLELKILIEVAEKHQPEFNLFLMEKLKKEISVNFQTEKVEELATVYLN